MHAEFFCVQDLSQARYETVRVVKHENLPVAQAAERFGFKSRSSYYLFARLLREQGFAGLFDLRPTTQKRSSAQGTAARTWGDECPDVVRPQASLWKRASGPWRNAFWGLEQKRHALFVQIVRAFVEGNGVRGIGRIFDVDKNTVLKYLERAALQCRRVTELLVRNLRVEELQLDEMWSFVGKKEKHLSEEEYLARLKGDQWSWVAVDARTKVIVQYEIGKRTYRLAQDLLRHFSERTDGTMPALVTSDDYKGYTPALLSAYGVVNEKNRRVPPPEMDYAVVSKTRRKGRIVAIDVRVVFGSEERIQRTLKRSPVSRSVNVAFVERLHLSRRQFNRRLTRKTLGFSKKLENHLWHYELETAIHNFVRPHRGIQKRTPMMAAGKTDHPWSVQELMSFTGG